MDSLMEYFFHNIFYVFIWFHLLPILSFAFYWALVTVKNSCHTPLSYVIKGKGFAIVIVCVHNGYNGRGLMRYQCFSERSDIGITLMCDVLEGCQ